MIRKRIVIIILSTLGTGLILVALILWGQYTLEAKTEGARDDLQLAYEWLPEPTIVPPTSTAPATPTPTASPTPTPQPLPPIRVIIPKIKVNSAIHEIGVVTNGDPFNPEVAWQQLEKGVGHDRDSANPGEAGNIVLLGHNNTAGQVFRLLSNLKQDDIVRIYTADREFSYAVREVDIVRAKAANAQDRQAHAYYLGPKLEETLTLVSCWPYATYTHRVYVVAKPLGIADQ
jgi:sortase A